MIRPVFYIISALLIGVHSASAEVSSLRQTVETLSSYGSRLSGYPGAEAAADYVENRLRSMGIESVIR